ncbi:MAG: hypothetical protein WC400_00760 [Patescibacteria group bacterium]
MGNKIVAEPDHPRVEQVLDSLMIAQREGCWPYGIAQQPHTEKNMPKTLKGMGQGKEKAEARFFMAICFYMLGGVESDTAFIAVSLIFDLYPHIFLTDFASLSNYERDCLQGEIEKILTEAGINRRSREVAKQWVYNFTKLDRYWGGDPRNLFKGKPNFDVLCQRLMRGHKFREDSPNGFYGFREKMVAMLAFFLMDRGLIPYYHLPVPVDFHVLRITTACRLVKVEIIEYDDDVEETSMVNLYRAAYLGAIRKLTYEYCVEHDASALRLCDCFWLLSRTGCRRHPDNSSRRVGGHHGRKTVVAPIQYEWSEARVRSYRRTCGECPINKFCDQAVPARLYYDKGQLMARGDRSKPSQLGLFDTDRSF